MRTRLKKLFWLSPLILAGMALFVWIGGQVVKLLWNALLPSLFGFPVIGFWQALGLLALGRILLGGTGFSGRGGGYYSRRRMQERMEFMTPEEREEFRQRMRRRWGLEPGPSQP